jgi:hypothetical protein
MAKPKLSGTQKKNLKKLIETLVKKGTEKAEILRSVAAKYSISPESVRWHLKRLGVPNGRPGRPPKVQKARAAKAAPLPLRVARKAANGVLHVVETVSGAVLRKAQEAKRLLPKLEKKLLASEKLAKAQARVARALRAAQAEAGKLKKKIANLISG